MAKFLTSNPLNSAIENILEEAEERLVLISPYIKLHSRYASVLKTKLEHDRLEIIVVFGKNEDDKSKSIREEDFTFFKAFKNIRILYEPRLHAKYYANEKEAILTSMNLYEYSQDNNIEAGILMNTSLLQGLANTFVTSEPTCDSQATDCFNRLIDQAEVLFDKEPQYESTMLGFSKKYKASIVHEDKLSEFFSGKLKIKSAMRVEVQHNTGAKGFCIRTGKEIPFNKEFPFTQEAYESWSKYRNNEYAEKYCHFSGEPSYGLTSFSKPILRKNWAKAKKVHPL